MDSGESSVASITPNTPVNNLYRSIKVMGRPPIVYIVSWSPDPQRMHIHFLGTMQPHCLFGSSGTFPLPPNSALFPLTAQTDPLPSAGNFAGGNRTFSPISMVKTLPRSPLASPQSLPLLPHILLCGVLHLIPTI